MYKIIIWGSNYIHTFEYRHSQKQLYENTIKYYRSKGYKELMSLDVNKVTFVDSSALLYGGKVA